MTTITVHSFKGGTGKSLIAVSMAYTLSRQGNRVLLIDGDYYAPCLATYFMPRSKFIPFTSFLDGKHKLDDVVNSTAFENLFICYAPPPRFNVELLQAGSKKHGQYLERLLQGTEYAHSELGFDYVIFDNSSGVSLSAINQLSCSNKSVNVIIPTKYGVHSSFTLLSTIYKNLRYFTPDQPRADFFVWNQVPQPTDASMKDTISSFLEYWTEKIESVDVPLATSIPYMSELATAMTVGDELDVPFISSLIQTHVDAILKRLIG